MDIKVTGPGGVKSTDKTKAKKKVDGPSFSSFLDQTTASSEVNNVTAPASAFDSPVTLVDENIPKEPGKHSAYLLDQLAELEKDILSASPTEAAANLQKALDQLPQTHNLTPEQQAVMDEVQMRAAVELAKLTQTEDESHD